MTGIVFLELAQEEMQAAASYYESRTTGLGQEFLREVQRAVTHIAENPRSALIVRGNIRRRLLHRFPFALLYRVDPEELVILAVMHLRRRPGYWHGRG